jgi:hypothetical protein
MSSFKQTLRMSRHLLADIAVFSAISLQLYASAAPLPPHQLDSSPVPEVGKAVELAQQPNPASPDTPSPVDPIPPVAAIKPPWPSPSLYPGVPSAFIANWGDVYIPGVAATSGETRPDADGSWVAGFGLGDSIKAVAVELNGGCGSFKNFCGNGGLGFRVGRVLISKPSGWLALAGAWQNVVQWGFEGTQDNIYSATLSYAFPLRPTQSGFAQTLQINAGVGNSSFALYSATNSEDQIGGFASIGVELSPGLGISAGWSGRGANAQLSYAPFRSTPISINLLGADLFNQNPDGTAGILSVSWGRTFLTPNFP